MFCIVDLFEDGGWFEVFLIIVDGFYFDYVKMDIIEVCWEDLVKFVEEI